MLKAKSFLCIIFLSFFSWSSSKILQLELVLSSGTVCLSMYSLVAGIFGMNIPYTWNDNHGYMFKYVSNQNSICIGMKWRSLSRLTNALSVFSLLQVVSLTGTLCVVVFVIIMSYARYKGLVGSWWLNLGRGRDCEGGMGRFLFSIIVLVVVLSFERASQSFYLSHHKINQTYWKELKKKTAEALLWLVIVKISSTIESLQLEHINYI